MPERSRRDLLYLAKLAEQAERYQEMVNYMKRLAALHIELDYEERSYFSVAFKDLVGARSTSWRILGNTQKREGAQANLEEVEMVKKYRKKIENELCADCLDCIATVEQHLLPYAFSNECKVYWRKTIGDYHRHLVEFGTEQQQKISKEAAYNAYQIGSEMAKKELTPTHPIRLGVQLSFSVYYFEVQKNPDLACQMAQQAFDEAISRLETLREDSYKDSTLIMQLLRDNVMSWKAEMGQDGKAKGESVRAGRQGDENSEVQRDVNVSLNTDKDDSGGAE